MNPYARVDCYLMEDPDVVRVGHRGCFLHLGGILYAQRNLTDGFVPEGVIQSLVMDMPRPKQALEALVAVGLWVKDPDRQGYRIRNYEKWQRSKSQVEASRDSNANRQAKYRHRNGVTNSVTNGVNHREVTRPVTVTETETETELVTQKSSSSGKQTTEGDERAPPVFEHEFCQILSTIPGWEKYGQPEPKALEWLGKHGIGEDYALETATALRAKWGGKGWRYVDPWSTFQNWVKKPPLNGRGGRANGVIGGDSDPYREDAERIARRRAERGES